MKNELHITSKMNGKMDGMQSISTSCLINPYCQARINQANKDGVDCICKHCYAERQMKMYKNMRPCLENNTRLLTSSILSVEELPIINAAFFRFEAFGDLNNDIQVINYFNICEKNPYVRFALWTKNPGLINQAIKKGFNKPNNLIIILSSESVNKPTKTNYNFIDKVFTVYDKKYASENNININCGARKCLTCLQCYLDNGVKEINELLK